MAASQTVQQNSVKLINNIQDISFGEIGIVVLGTWLAIFLVRLTLPYLAARGPSRVRLYLLAAVPIIRLVLLVVAILWIVPIVFNITFQNFLVISGAASVAIGFAFKELSAASSRAWWRWSSGLTGPATGSTSAETTARCGQWACARSMSSRRTPT